MTDALVAGDSGPVGDFRARLLPERRLMKLAAAGNKAAFAEIFRRHHQPLFLYAKSILGNEQDARDAVQTTMVKLLASLPGDDREIALKPWLYRIAHNEAISIVRRRPSGDLDPEQQLEAAAADDVELHMRTDQLLADLGRLPDRQRSAIVLRELSGLAHKEIALALGVSAGAAKQAVYEGRLALQEMEEGREMECASAREAISARDRRLLRGRRIRAHMRACDGCRSFAEAIDQRQAGFAGLAPLPIAASQQLLASILGSGGGSAGGMGLLGGAGLAGGAKALTGGAAAQLAAAVVVATGAGVAVTAATSDDPERSARGPIVASAVPTSNSGLVSSVSGSTGASSGGSGPAAQGGFWPGGADVRGANGPGSAPGGGGKPPGESMIDDPLVTGIPNGKIPKAPENGPQASGPSSPGAPGATNPPSTGGGGGGGDADSSPGEPAGPGKAPESPPGKTDNPGNGKKPDSPPGKPENPGNKPDSPPGQGGNPGNKPDSPPGKPENPGNKPDSPPGQDGNPGNKPDAPPGKPENPGKPDSPPGNPDAGKPDLPDIPSVPGNPSPPGKPDNPGKGPGKP